MSAPVTRRAVLGTLRAIGPSTAREIADTAERAYGSVINACWSLETEGCLASEPTKPGAQRLRWSATGEWALRDIEVFEELLDAYGVDAIVERAEAQR